MVGALRTAPRAVVLAAATLLPLGVAIRLNNALRYPADWGFDASYNWRFLYRLSEDWALPPPDAGWSTGDPPLYFLTGALAFSGLDGLGARDAAVWIVPALNLVFGLGVVALAFELVRHADPGDPARAALAAGLLLFLPAHIHMSAMVNEGMLAALFTSATVHLLAVRPMSARSAAGAGLASGLALLTRLTGVLALATAVLAWTTDALRRRTPREALAPLAVLLLVAGVVGGWYWGRNLLLYGYLQPYALPAHEVMFEMPPGERGWLDYVRFPLATFTDPQLLNPDLLRSVWGSTYVSTWFDGHRVFLPTEGAGVRALGTLTLLLALLPTAAGLLGAGRGLRRLAAGGAGPDLPLLWLSGLTLAGYAFFTWRNPWFAVLKGTSLLGLSLPFSFYASEVLAGWLRLPGPRGRLVAGALAALVVCVALSCTFGAVFERTEVSGLPWRAAGAP